MADAPSPSSPAAPNAPQAPTSSSPPASVAAQASGAAMPASAPVQQGAPSAPPVVAEGEVKRAPASGRMAGMKASAARAWAAVRATSRRATRAILGLRREGLPTPLSAQQSERLDILRAVADRKRAPRVLFVDGTNSNRSQMAEAYAVTYGLYAESAATFPSPSLDRLALVVLKEKGLDISAWSPKILVPSRLPAFDRVVVMGDVLPDAMMRSPNVEKWNFPLDPKGFPLQGYRLVRDQTEGQVKQLAKRLANLKSRRSGPVPTSMQPARAPGSRWNPAPPVAPPAPAPATPVAASAQAGQTGEASQPSVPLPAASGEPNVARQT